VKECEEKIVKLEEKFEKMERWDKRRYIGRRVKQTRRE